MLSTTDLKKHRTIPESARRPSYSKCITFDVGIPRLLCVCHRTQHTRMVKKSKGKEQKSQSSAVPHTIPHLQPEKMSTTMLQRLFCIHVFNFHKRDSTTTCLPPPRRRKFVDARRIEKGLRRSGIPQPDTPSWRSSCECRVGALSATPVFFFFYIRDRIQKGTGLRVVCGVFFTGGIRCMALRQANSSKECSVGGWVRRAPRQHFVFGDKGGESTHFQRRTPPVPVPRTAAKIKAGEVISHLHRSDVKKGAGSQGRAHARAR